MRISDVGRDADRLWAITCFFNPAGSRRRLANYRVFRQRLTVPLVAVELAYGSNFELNENDAEILVQLLGGPDILWQKERLLNLALEVLPSSCCQVAWLDCDIVFEADDWAERTSALLDRFMLVQPFSRVHWMPPNWEPGEARPPEGQSLGSVPFLIASGVPVANCLGVPTSQITCAPGGVWAADRQLLDQHSLYDACVIGGADSVIVRAAFGCFEDATRLLHLNNQGRKHYLAWANPFYATVRAQVAFVDGNLLHLWHGKFEHRGYLQRHEELRRFQFNPFKDIAIAHNGAWRWNSDKREMHDYVRDYFASRREDG